MLRCTQHDSGAVGDCGTKGRLGDTHVGSLGCPSVVTLSEAKGLARGAARCFAALSMTTWAVCDSGAQGRREGSLDCPSVVTLSEAKGLSRGAQRCFAALSMTMVLSLTMGR